MNSGTPERIRGSIEVVLPLELVDWSRAKDRLAMEAGREFVRVEHDAMLRARDADGRDMVVNEWIDETCNSG